jgi:hypothetical protein
MVCLTFAFQVPYYARSEWTIERHHFEAQYGEPLETIDDDLVVIHARFDDLFDVINERLDDFFGVVNERLDDLFDAIVRWIVRWTVYVFVRASISGPHHGIPSLLRGRCCGLEPKRMHLFGRSPNASKLHLLRCSSDMGESAIVHPPLRSTTRRQAPIAAIRRPSSRRTCGVIEEGCFC